MHFAPSVVVLTILLVILCAVVPAAAKYPDDLPEPEKGGSHGRQVAVGDVQRLIGRAFELGADHRHFGGLTFTSW